MDSTGLNLEKRAEAMERLDSGQRLAPAMYRELLSSPAPSTGTTLPAECRAAIFSELEDMRAAGIGAMGWADLMGDRSAHVAIAQFVSQINDLRTVLEERWS